MPIVLDRQKTLQMALYAGIALIVVSVLFLGQGQTDGSFVRQTLTVLAIPALFYGIGYWVTRIVSAPLAGPGIIATGSWLLSVALIHLYDRQALIGYGEWSLFWPILSVSVAAIITLTAYRYRIWMLVPLVSLVQVNAFWALLSPLGVWTGWVPLLTLILAAVWAGVPQKDGRWRMIYQTSALVLIAGMLALSLWLPYIPPSIRLITWGAATALVTLIGHQRRWTMQTPLTLILLVLTTLVGLPVSALPLVWLVIGIGVLWLIDPSEAKAKNGLFQPGEVTLAVIVLLIGAAALFAQVNPLRPDATMLVMLGFPIPALVYVAVAGLLLSRIGRAYEQVAGIHAGLWLMAAAWIGLFHWLTLPAEIFGLWIALLVAGVLLVQRLLNTRRKDKHKSQRSVVETMGYWPGADLSIGLSTLALVWTASHIQDVVPQVLLVTLTLIIGLWLVIGLLYRLPILIHAALWVSPMPFALLLILVSPVFWQLSTLGIPWQLLGVTYLAIGFVTPRYRPTMLAPFFIVGNVLVMFGFTVASATPLFLPATLTVVLIVSILSSAAILIGRHPAWDAFIERFFPAERLPFANRYLRQTFLFFSTWLSAIWLHLMLGYTSLTLVGQGMVLVGLACAYVALERLLARFRQSVELAFLSAAAMVWMVGLLEVFPAPREALFTALLGVIVSVEIFRRTRQRYWIVVVFAQCLFAALPISYLFGLPSRLPFLAIGVGFALIGLLWHQRNREESLIAVVAGTLLISTLWLTGYRSINSGTTTLLEGLSVLVVSLVAIAVYRHWAWLFVSYAVGGLLIGQLGLHIDPVAWVILGLIQWVAGVELIRLIRPARFRQLVTFRRRTHEPLDWATPFYWMGLVCMAGGLWGFNNQTLQLLPLSLLVAEVFAFYSVRLRMPQLPFLAMGAVLIGVTYSYQSALFHQALKPTYGASSDSGMRMVLLLGGAIAALAIRLTCVWLVQETAFLARFRGLTVWVRPLLVVSLGLFGAALVGLIASGYAGASGVNANLIPSLTGTLLTVFAATVYPYRKQAIWVWIALVVGSASWLMLLRGLNLADPASVFISVGLAFVLVSTRFGGRLARQIELVGGVILLTAGGLSMERMGVIAATALGSVPYIVCLIGAGWLLHKRQTFGFGVLLIVAELVLRVSRVNPWLLPLGCGLLLLAGALLIEKRPEALEGWIGRWAAYWGRRAPTEKEDMPDFPMHMEEPMVEGETG